MDVFPDVIQLLEQHIDQAGGSSGEDANVVAAHARRLLEHLVEQSGKQPARQVLDLLLAHKVVPSSTSLLNPFVKVHLAKYVPLSMCIFVV